ncbi:MAG: serine/threonine protein kinase [Acidobacteria bacterium]|nr:serine/threonine protein kinase [Acidobacteriota bacterium]MCA1651618.1 serine/threonine protein kinase [Acidobacteriota bacterium]
MLSVGQVLDGRYEIVGPLAEGGMGAVYKARRTLLGDEVAIKISHRDHSGPGPIERFLRESRACALLRHPNIVSILDFNVDDEERPFLVMELLNGRSLRDEIAAHGYIPLREVQEIVPQLCAALQLAHNRGIVHRDLKPANVVAHEFAPGERVYKVVDFGLANMRESLEDTRLTGPHQFIGTVAYASPEQLTGAPVDARADIYSLGAVVFEMLTGRAPFEGEDAAAVLTGHITGPPPAPSSLRPELPPWIDIAVVRAMAKNPADRWPDIGEFGRVIAAGSGPRPMIGSSAIRGGGLLSTYELGERIGSGRLGSEVYRGVHRTLGHTVAIRMLRGHTAERSRASVRTRFLREARTLQIAHPSIIQVRELGEEGDLLYVVTDFIEGRSLRERMKAEGPIPWVRLRPLLAQLVEAARVLHRRNGMLCGLTPDIMRVSADDEGERLMISTAGIWEAQDLLGTLHEKTLRGIGLADEELRYVAPELMTGRTADVRSDIFTMGVLAYEMASGSLPYDGTSMQKLLGAMLKGAVDPRPIQAALTNGAATAVLKALRPEPPDRFATAPEFGAALFG